MILVVKYFIFKLFIETEAFLKQIEVMSQMDEMIKLQKKAEKIDNIKQLHKIRKEKTNQVLNQLLKLKNSF